VELFSTDDERKIEVSWDNGEQKKYFVSLEIIGIDRAGLLNEISQVFTDFGANVIEGSIKTLNQQAKSMFKIEIHNINQLKQIFRRVQRIKGIENISRVKDYINYPQENIT
jgi:GTP pyrophosphokinase